MMCYLHRGFIREITSPMGSFFRRMTSLRRKHSEFQCATSTGSSSSREISHRLDGSYDKMTATIRRQTRVLSPPPCKQCNNDVRQRRRRQQRWRRQEGGGGLIVNRNDGDGGGVGLGIGLRRQIERGRRPISTSDLA